jgi:8-oxo-dGTP pyrophosphatase MutT (NUDIX family)
MIIDFDSLKKALQQRERVKASKNNDYSRQLTQAGVLFLFYPGEGGWKAEVHKSIKKIETLFIERSHTRGHRRHRGQFAFPGGIREPEDSSIEETALREAREEVGMPPAQAEILGLWDDLILPSDFIVTPVLARLHQKFPLSIDERELEDAFWFDLGRFVNHPTAYYKEVFIHGQKRHSWHYPFSFGEVWGATGTIINNFLDFAIEQKLGEFD